LTDYKNPLSSPRVKNRMRKYSLKPDLYSKLFQPPEKYN
jgi:hypothetical protein